MPHSLPLPRAVTPPLLLTSDRGSFAHHTLKDRVPGILRETMALNAFPPTIIAALEALTHRVGDGPHSRFAGGHRR